MYQTIYTEHPSERLIEYLRTNPDRRGLKLRRRAVLAPSGDGSWQLICCTLEALPRAKKKPEVAKSRHYSQAILYEDWLTPQGCLKFIGEIQDGRVMIDELTIERDGNPQWYLDRLSPDNNYMSYVG